MKPRDYLNKAKESLDSRDVYLQLMPLDLAWRGVCNETYLAVQNLINGILLANNRVTKCKTIGILSQMLNNFTIFEVPSDLDNISMKLTEWGLSKGIPEFDKETYFKAEEVIKALTDILKKEIYRTGNIIDKLDYVIDREYGEKCNEWMNLSPYTLIEMSDEISTARFVKNHIMEAVNMNQAGYLLQFKYPLEILTDKLSEYNESDFKTKMKRFKAITSDMYDKQIEYADYELSEGILMN